MNSFSNKLQKFFVYSFTGVSVLLVVLGISRIKKTDSFAQSAPADTSSDRKFAVLGSTQVVFKGKTYSTPWGDVVTQIQVKDGKVVAVTIPTLPDSPPSIQAEPYLIAQALKTGGSNIQSISGATITSRAFKASLESALAQAANTTTGAGIANSIIEPTSTVATNTTQAPKTTTTKTGTAPATQASAGVSGTFTGKGYQTPWGNAVASISVVNGKITGVTMPQVPQSPPSQYAESYLVAQALASGSANIQGVSGATYTSIAFKSSLESAISLANTTASAQGKATVTSSPSTTTVSPAANTKTSVPRRYREDEWDD